MTLPGAGARGWLRTAVRDVLVAVGLMVVATVAWAVVIGLAALALLLLGMAVDPLFPDSTGAGDGHQSEPVTVGPGISSDYWGAGCDPGGDFSC